MATHERGRSPQAFGQQHTRHSLSASPHPPAAFTNAEYETNSYSQAQSQSAFSAYDPSFTQDFSQAQYLDPSFATDFPQQLHSQQPSMIQHDSQSFLQSQPQQYGHLDGHIANPRTSSDFSTTFPSFDSNQSGFDQNQSLDPTLLDFDPTQLDLLPQQQLNNTTTSLDPMAATMQAHTQGMYQDIIGRRLSGGSPSPHASPSFPQFQPQTSFHTPTNRPRNTSESLDPSSAMFPPHGQNEWAAVGTYRSHQRTPSDNLSDISSHSAQASPYLGNLGDFDVNGHSSPLLAASHDPSFNGDLGLHGFSLNEQQQHQQHIPSPGPSPFHSPRLDAQQPLPQYTPADNYGLDGAPFVSQHNGYDMFPGIGVEPFPSLNNHVIPNVNLNGDVGGAADQMSPPEVVIDYAPSTGPSEPMRSGSAEHTLSPPLRSAIPFLHHLNLHADKRLLAQSRNRTRAKSDSGLSRPVTPNGLPMNTGRGRSPSLQPQHSIDSATDSLSPFQPPSRSPSPSTSSRGRAASTNSTTHSGARGRSASNASDREYLLDLATKPAPSSNPAEANGNGGSNSASKRLQKHPANFQCTLCPKRFTRAYNLRSHLRTHTDERPFVCTVCGKAFARQHDRKRHEGLHSGEKRFVCKGVLLAQGNGANGGTPAGQAQWGCGRRFARADALGRHFRSEAGRVCIQPLLDEEAGERRRREGENMQQQHMQNGMETGVGAEQYGGEYIPAALLQQYPALAGIDWSRVPQGPPPDELDLDVDDYVSGNGGYEGGGGGFEGSSGGEMGWDEEMSEGELVAMQGQGLGVGGIGAQGLGLGVQYQGGGGRTDYLSDFEGR